MTEKDCEQIKFEEHYLKHLTLSEMLDDLTDDAKLIDSRYPAFGANTLELEINWTKQFILENFKEKGK
jgi:hypothetical protein